MFVAGWSRADEGARAIGMVAVVLAATGLLLALLTLAAGPDAARVMAQQPSPAPAPTPFDPRGGGTGPGLVGAPLLAALTVIALGIGAAAVTAIYVRLVGRR